MLTFSGRRNDVTIYFSLARKDLLCRFTCERRKSFQEWGTGWQQGLQLMNTTFPFRKEGK